MTYIINVTHIK